MTLQSDCDSNTTTQKVKMEWRRGPHRYLLHPAKNSIKFLLLFIFLFFASCTSKNIIKSQNNTTIQEILFQVSTFSALLNGTYEGTKTFRDLKKLGDFGIGTLQFLDGEMIALDREFYQIKVDGQTSPIHNSMKTPFAAVTFFEVDKTLKIEGDPIDFQTLKTSLDSLIFDHNIIYAIRIDGHFKSVNARSVPAQDKPYRNLEDVIKYDQVIYELREVNGTMIGFWYPAYTGGISIPGYHFHFITQDRTKGGHVLDCVLLEGTVHIDFTPNIHIELLASQK